MSDKNAGLHYTNFIFYRLLLWRDKDRTGRLCLQYYVWAWHEINLLQELRVGTYMMYG